jgi:glycosyltransferase involved in cell wall biosynthesis
LIVQALDSLLQQTFRDFETIVVDDGSTDQTRVVVGAHPLRARYLYTHRAGPAEARNAGMRAATGEFVAYLDSDDLYYPHKLELQVDWLRRHPDVGMVYTDFSAFDDDGFWDERHLTTYHASAFRGAGRQWDSLFAQSEPLAAQGCAPADRAYFGDIYAAYLKDTIVFTNSMLFRRRLLDRTGLQSRRFGHFHDLEFALRLCKAAPVGYRDTPTYKLRYHAGQVTSTTGTRAEYVAIRKQQDLLRVLRVHGSADDAPWSGPDQYHAALCRLAQAAAVPMIAYGGPSRHRRIAYPRRARAYLRFARRHGGRFVALMVMSYAPAPVRRAWFAAADRARVLRQAGP